MRIVHRIRENSISQRTNLKGSNVSKSIVKVEIDLTDLGFKGFPIAFNDHGVTLYRQNAIYNAGVERKFVGYVYEGYKDGTSYIYRVYND